MAQPYRIVMLGPPGAGKGTQSVLLSKRLGVPHISTGEILRAESEKSTPLGARVKPILASGDLVSDDLIIEVFEARIAQDDCQGGFVLDGFPRTVAQAKALDELLSKLNKRLSHVVELKVPESVLLERIQRRGATGSGRSDDNAAIAARRLQVYWELTAPVTGFYREKGTVVEVQGLGSVEEVQNTLLASIVGQSR